MSYEAPLREMIFAMREHGALDAVLAQPGRSARRLAGQAEYVQRHVRHAAE